MQSCAKLVKKKKKTVVEREFKGGLQRPLPILDYTVADSYI